MSLKVFFSCGISLLLSACLTIKREPSSFKVITVTGPIEANNVESIIQKIRHPPRPYRLIINSGGGDELATLKLAKEISRQNIDVVVDGACISACAHIILPAARNVFINEGSFIGFHGNIFGWLELFYRTDQSEYNDLLEDSASIAKFLESKDANIDTLFCTAALHKPRKEWSRDSSQIPVRRTKYSFLIADKGMLEWYGVKATYVSGYSAESMKIKRDKSGVNLKGSRSNWTIEDCEAVDTTAWKKVKKAMRNYSGD